MDPENTEQASENESDSPPQQSSEQSTRIKLRDLSPEKDPMGAGDGSAANE